ncbi:MAG: rhodanese-like domain-containing protein, partial [Acidimicrobiales bacterium]
MPTPRDLLNQAKERITEITTEEAEGRLGQATFLDVREPDEYEQGALAGAVALPRGHLEFQVEGKLPDKSVPLVVYCAGGVRSAFAADTLEQLGYTDVVSMAGGFN